MKLGRANGGRLSATVFGLAATLTIGLAAAQAADSAPDVSNDDIATLAPGFYEVEYERPPAPGDDAENVVYWLPADEADSARVPPEISAIKYFDEVAAILSEPGVQGAAFSSPAEIDIYVSDPPAGARKKQPGPRTFLHDPSDCPNGAVCLYEHQSYGGDWAVITGSNDWVNVTGNMGDKTTSVVNQRPLDSKLAAGYNGNGDRRCLDGGERVREFTGSFNDATSSVRRTLVDSEC